MAATNKAYKADLPNSSLEVQLDGLVVMSIALVVSHAVGATPAHMSMWWSCLGLGV